MFYTWTLIDGDQYDVSKNQIAAIVHTIKFLKNILNNKHINDIR